MYYNQSLKIYYKIVKRDAKNTKNLVSCVTPYARIKNKIETPTEYSKFIVQYRVGRWTYPKLKNTKLFIFGDINDALDFRAREGGFIYECYAFNPQKHYDIAELSSYENMIRYWKNKNNIESSTVEIFYTPPHTYSADAVYLIKRWSY